MSTKVLPSPEAEWRHFSRWWDELLRRAKRALGTDFGTNLPVASSPSLTAITGLAPTTPLCVQIKSSQSAVFLCRCSKAIELAALWGPLRLTFDTDRA